MDILESKLLKSPKINGQHKNSNHLNILIMSLSISGRKWGTDGYKVEFIQAGTY